jgi:hypothetical protein
MLGIAHGVTFIEKDAIMRPVIAALIAALTMFPSLLNAQQKPGVVAPAEKLAEGWEEIDQRLIFLMIRLANVEASLDAVENAVTKSTGKRVASLGTAKRAEAGNELMDRKGGGPMKWSEFYGRTAEKFFYHPTDRNTTYHTTTVLQQRGPEADNKVGGGVPAGQGLPVHQRPPQFDYIYRANANAKAKAEQDAAELKGKIEALFARRAVLEAEQSALWCEVAFRAVSRYDLDKKPLYRFEPLVVDATTEARQHAEIMKAAASFMRVALSIIDEAQKDQAVTFSKIKAAVSDSRQSLNDAWLRQAVDVTDRTTTEGKFAALAKRLDDMASNLSESYVVAIDGDQAKDQQRKDTFRALLQESLVSYAEIILALDEMSVAMKNDWNIKPDVDKPIQFVSLASIEAVRPVPIPQSTSPTEAKRTIETAAPVGSWLEQRPNSPVGNRFRTFKPDGTLVQWLPKTKEESTGTWRRDGNRIYFTLPREDKWFEIVKVSKDQITISIEGQREYVWHRSSPGANSASATTIDLLQLIAPEKNSIAGTWVKKGSALVAPQDPFSRLFIPYAPPAEYDLSVVAQRTQGGDSLVIGLVILGNQCWAMIDGFSGSKTTSGLHFLDGLPANKNETTYQGEPVGLENPTTIKCKVRKMGSQSASVSVNCNGMTVIDWKGDPKRLSLRPAPNNPYFHIYADQDRSHAKFLHLGAFSNTEITITRLELAPATDGD